jgi:hypothetical protein
LLDASLARSVEQLQAQGGASSVPMRDRVVSIDSNAIDHRRMALDSPVFAVVDRDRRQLVLLGSSESRRCA